VVVGSNHRAGETFQNDAESSRCNIKATRLEPNTIRVRHPETLIFQIDVRNEVFAAPSTRLKAVGETAKGIDWHMSRLVGQIEMSISVRSASQPSTLGIDLRINRKLTTKCWVTPKQRAFARESVHYLRTPATQQSCPYG